MRHFLDLSEVGSASLRTITERAKAWKSASAAQGADQDLPLKGKALAMIFEKPSTRTRVSFERAVQQLGGEAIVLSSAEMQMGRGESVSDTAKVLSRYCDALMIRTFGHQILAELADAATVPVINGLTDQGHPCQVMADVMTFEEHRGAIKGQRLAYFGDGNNMAHSLMQAADLFDFELTVATPEPLAPDARYLNDHVTLTHDPDVAARGARALITDTWVSMGDDAAVSRHNLLRPYQVNSALMAQAAKDAIFMHCLPAHREEEVTTEVIDGPQSVVFDEAENRLHVQKAVLGWCLGVF